MTETGKPERKETGLSAEEQLLLIRKNLQSITLGQNPPALSYADFSGEFEKVAGITNYLAKSLFEINSFLKQLAAGDFNAEPPSRDNYMAGYVKEIQSQFRHFVWQAEQIANGDYSQKIDFMGEVSASFNSMTLHLQEWERQLKEEIVKKEAVAAELARSTALLNSVLDGIKDWVVVTSADYREVLYINEEIKSHLENCQAEECHHDGVKKCLFFKTILDSADAFASLEGSKRTDVYCEKRRSWYVIDTNMIKWNDGSDVLVHILSDVTEEKTRSSRLEEIAYIDQGTGIYNRRYGLEFLEDLIKERRSIGFCLCYFDLDGLKMVNDNYGHGEGDEYIRSFVKILRSSFRKEDVLFRLGGDEFGVVMKNCSMAAARRALGSFDSKIDKYNETSGKPYPVSASYGVVHAAGGKELTVDKLLGEADEEMYKDKQRRKKTRQD